MLGKSEHVDPSILFGTTAPDVTSMIFKDDPPGPVWAVEAAARARARTATRETFTARRRAGLAACHAQRLSSVVWVWMYATMTTITETTEPSRHRFPWTPAEDELLAELAGQRTPNRVIAERLNRSVATVAVRRSKFQLTKRLEHCPVCTADLVQPALGRPRIYCGDECLNQARVERARQAAEIRTCQAEECDAVLAPGRRRFCSRECSRRACEVTFAPIRSARQAAAYRERHPEARAWAPRPRRSASLEAGQPGRAEVIAAGSAERVSLAGTQAASPGPALIL